jgi:hypothetical protein
MHAPIPRGVFMGGLLWGIVALFVPAVGAYTTSLGCNNVTVNGTIVIPENVTVIPDNAFRGCANLDIVTFPSTLQEIGEFAFADSGITEVDLSGTDVTKIEYATFHQCYSLENVAFPSTLQTIGQNVFKMNTFLTRVTALGTNDSITTTSLQNLVTSICSNNNDGWGDDICIGGTGTFASSILSHANNICGLTECIEPAATTCNNTMPDYAYLKYATKEWLENSTAAELEYCHISDWDVSSVSSLHNLLHNTTLYTLTKPGMSIYSHLLYDDNSHAFTYDIRESAQFLATKNFNENLNNWTVSNVTDMSGLFFFAENFNHLMIGTSPLSQT